MEIVFSSYNAPFFLSVSVYHILRRKASSRIWIFQNGTWFFCDGLPKITLESKTTTAVRHRYAWYDSHGRYVSWLYVRVICASAICNFQTDGMFSILCYAKNGEFVNSPWIKSEKSRKALVSSSVFAYNIWETILTVQSWRAK